jgi:predicted transposase/invertase (TIGR01784 family)
VELPVWTKWLKAQKSSIIEREGKWLYFLTRAKGMDEDTLLATLARSRVQGGPGRDQRLYTTEQKRRHAYDMRENYQRILASFKATDFDEGKAERNLEVAQKMKTEGLPLDQISRITGLAFSEIEKL